MCQRQNPASSQNINDTVDVFVRDRQRRTTTRVNVGRHRVQANADSSDAPSISQDGRFVAFSSTAMNLVPETATRAASLRTPPLQRSHATRERQLARREVRCIDRDEDSRTASCSQHASNAPNGRRVAFTSLAPGLVPRPATNDPDYFVHDLRSGRTRRVNVSAQVPEQSLDVGDLQILAMANRFRRVLHRQRPARLPAGLAQRRLRPPDRALASTSLRGRTTQQCVRARSGGQECSAAESASRRPIMKRRPRGRRSARRPNRPVQEARHPRGVHGLRRRVGVEFQTR
jgi:hypothetical protein